ncbi:MAG: hypothetical protein M1465_01540 [Candidatus Marsarchaeota archaeon]|jgi:hypothetical protein|nr:hypothetical protein [Candidatus Marsarchaeota archaeon]
MENALAFVVSLVTVIVVILAISIFMLYGATSLFYASALISIALGFLDAWFVSREGSSAKLEEQRNARKTNGSTRKRVRKRKKL